MSEIELPKDKQPDAVPQDLTVTPPSLILYILLIIAVVSMITMAFYNKTDWPGLLLNLATEIFGAIIILILVERKLRASELRKMRRIPQRLGMLSLLLVSIRKRQFYRYSQRLLDILNQTLSKAVRRPSLDYLMDKFEAGFVLYGAAGTGKTVWFQFATADLVQIFLRNPKKNKTVILFPLSRWRPQVKLEDAIFDHLNSFSRVYTSSFKKALINGELIIILDGVDKVISSSRVPNFSSQLNFIRQDYPKISWVIGCRRNVPNPADDLDTITLGLPTKEELVEINRRLNK